MTWLTSRHDGERPGSATARGRSWRRTGGLLLGGLGISLGVGLASAGNAAAAAHCPTGSVLFRNACIVIGLPTATPTTSPMTTPPTTAAPIIQLPPVVVPPVAVPPLLAPPATPLVVTDAAQRLLDLANGERQRAGLGPLTSRDDMVSIAIAHSRQMAQTGDIFHSTSFFAPAVKNLLNAAVRGENVAYNSDIDNVHARLMASAGHRANILDPRFSVVGFGVVRATDGRYFITQNFIQPAGAQRTAAPAAAPRAVAPAASRKVAAPAAPPTTAAPAPPTTVAAPVPVAVTAELTPVMQLDNVSSAVPAGSAGPNNEITPPLAASAVVLLAGAMGACCIVPRRRG